MRFTLRDAHLIDATTDIARGAITIDGTLIQSSERPEYPLDRPEKNTDAADMLVMPGFIDVQTHGGGGYNLHTTDAGEIRSYARWVPETGVTSFLITIVGVAGSIPEQQLRAAVEALDDGVTGAAPLGIHLEGPYINVARRGARQPAWLPRPDESETDQWLALTHEYLRLLTLAPELPGASAMIRRLGVAGITASSVPTDAPCAQTPKG